MRERAALIAALWRRSRAIRAVVQKEQCGAIVACSGGADLLDLPAAYLASRLARVRFYPYMTPDEFRKDKRWDISYRVDSHPTSWGNRLMAIDILGRLVKHELLPPTKFTDSEREIIAKGERASLDASDRELAQYMLAVAQLDL